MVVRAFALLALLALAGCHPPPTMYAVKIVDIYRTGLAMRFVITVVELPDGTRHRVRGKLGKEGETVQVWFTWNMEPTTVTK